MTPHIPYKFTVLDTDVKSFIYVCFQDHFQEINNTRHCILQSDNIPVQHH